MSERRRLPNRRHAETFELEVRDREWWAKEATRIGSDWAGVVNSAHTLLAITGLTLAPIDDWGAASFRQLCAEADRTDRRAPRGAVWSAAGRCINRFPPRKALKTFLKWCDQHEVVRTDAMFVFEAIVDKELAK
jgi:hypothetical protein